MWGGRRLRRRLSLTDPLSRESVRVLIDADACPVKDEIYDIALRHGAAVSVVANQYLRVPDHPLIERIVVSDAFDAADDFIAEQASPAAIIITSDILLADRCLKSDAVVLSPKGDAFTADSIGAAIATRAILADLRAGGDSQIGGPAPFSKQDRSRFKVALHETLERMRRNFSSAH